MATIVASATLVLMILSSIGLNRIECASKAVDGHNSLPWWKSMSIYNVYPKSFKDSNGDGIGDLNGITQKLQHFVDLGVDIIWLNPFFSSPGIDHGYDISNFTAIDPIYGTMEDFMRLIRKMKKLGLKFMIDMVMNHCSDQHPWFKMSKERVEPYTDYFVWRDAKGYDTAGNPIPPNNWTSVFQGTAWTWDAFRKQFYYHAFSKHQPDFNLRNPLVVEEIKNILRFWLDRGVSGIRVDAPKYFIEDSEFRDEPSRGIIDPFDRSTWDDAKPYTNDLIESYEITRYFKQFVEEEYTSKDGEDRIFIAEVFASVAKTVRWLDYVHLVYNYEFQLIPFAINATILDDAANSWKGFTATYMSDNHDFVRTAQKFSEEFVDVMYMIITMLPGNVAIYYGQEIGMTGMKLRPDQIQDSSNKWIVRDAVRTPMQWDNTLNAGFTTKYKSWLPVNPNYWTINVAKEKSKNVSHYRVFKSLMNLRKTATFKYGKLQTYVLSEWVWAFTRALDNVETYVIVANIGTESEIIDLSIIPNLPPYLKVLVSSINLDHRPGDYIRSKPYLKNLTVLLPKSSLVLSTNVDQPEIISKTTESVVRTDKPSTTGSAVGLKVDPFGLLFKLLLLLIFQLIRY